MIMPTPSAGASTSARSQKPITDDEDIMFALNQDPGMRTQLTDGGYDVIDITLEKMPAFMAEKSRAYIEDAKAAGLLK
jgi:hypothetical protein